MDKLTNCIVSQTSFEILAIAESRKQDLTTCVLAQFGSFLVLVTIAWAHKTKRRVTRDRECSSKHGRQEIWPYKWLIKKINNPSLYKLCFK